MSGWRGVAQTAVRRRTHLRWLDGWSITIQHGHANRHDLMTMVVGRACEVTGECTSDKSSVTALLILYALAVSQ